MERRRKERRPWRKTENSSVILWERKNKKKPPPLIVFSLLASHHKPRYKAWCRAVPTPFLYRPHPLLDSYLMFSFTFESRFSQLHANNLQHFVHVFVFAFSCGRGSSSDDVTCGRVPFVQRFQFQWETLVAHCTRFTPAYNILLT